MSIYNIIRKINYSVTNVNHGTISEAILFGLDKKEILDIVGTEGY